MGTTTSNRGYRIPQSTDGAVNLTSYWVNLATDIDTDVSNVIINSGYWVDCSAGFNWTADGTNPAIGNGTIQASYKQIGKTVTYKGFIVMGSTTTFGTTGWRIPFPVTPTSLASSFGGVIGTAFVYDSSAGAQYVSVIASVTTGYLHVHASPTTVTANLVGSLIPFTWAVSDRVSWFVEYETP